MRRIKSVALTLPAVVGPYASVNDRLTLLASAVRCTPELFNGKYRVLDDHSVDVDIRQLPSPPLRTDLSGVVQSIATSRANIDAGMFEVNFRDERYLPFEGAGAISSWQLDLNKTCNDFDLDTLSDVVIELRYTAREVDDAFRRTVLGEVVYAASGTLYRMFSAKVDFADAWNEFLYPVDDQPGQTLKLDLSRSRFPFRAQRRGFTISAARSWSRRVRPEPPASQGLPLRCRIRRDKPLRRRCQRPEEVPEGCRFSQADTGIGYWGHEDKGHVPAGRVPSDDGSSLAPPGTPGEWKLLLQDDAIATLPAEWRAQPAGAAARNKQEMINDRLRTFGRVLGLPEPGIFRRERGEFP